MPERRRKKSFGLDSPPNADAVEALPPTPALLARTPFRAEAATLPRGRAEERERLVKEARRGHG